jgi:hypothetical protein
MSNRLENIANRSNLTLIGHIRYTSIVIWRDSQCVTSNVIRFGKKKKKADKTSLYSAMHDTEKRFLFCPHIVLWVHLWGWGTLLLAWSLKVFSRQILWKNYSKFTHLFLLYIWFSMIILFSLLVLKIDEIQSRRKYKYKCTSEWSYFRFFFEKIVTESSQYIL